MSPRDRRLTSFATDPSLPKEVRTTVTTTGDGACDFCGWEFPKVGPLAITHVPGEKMIHEPCGRTTLAICPWCHPHVKVQQEDGTFRFRCVCDGVMPPELRAEIVLRRAGGEGAWKPVK